jgi:hypothetical protein
LTDPYVEIGTDPFDPDGYCITADQLAVARLRESESVEGEWELRSAGPATFGPVSFDGDLDVIKERAISRIENHLREIQPDLVRDDDDD